MNEETYSSVEEAQAAFNAVPSYFERPLSQEEEEEICWRVRSWEQATVVGVVDLEA